MKALALVALLAAWSAAPCAEPAAEPEPPPPKAREALDEIDIQMLLATRRISFDFVDTPVADVVAFLQDLLGVNVIVAPRARRGARITLKANDMRAASALEWIARLCGGHCQVEHEAVSIAAGGPHGPAAGRLIKDVDTLRILKALKTKRISFDFVDTPLRDALGFVGAHLGTQIVLPPWVPKDAAITLRARNMTAGSALHWMAALAGCTLEVRDEAVFINRPQPRELRRPRAAPPPQRGGF